MQRASAFCLASCLALFSFSIPAAAVEIVSPKNGDVLPIGSEVVVQVRPSPADDIVRVYLGSSEDAMKYNDATRFFEQHIKLRGDAWGPIEIDVRSINSKNVIGTAEVKVEVKLPPVLPLISFRVHADQRKLVLETIGEKHPLQVIGEFPDGSVRIISAKVYGTTYVSRNTDVATVDANGMVTAVGSGETTIVARNGERETEATIVVKIKLPEVGKKET